MKGTATKTKGPTKYGITFTPGTSKKKPKSTQVAGNGLANRTQKAMQKHYDDLSKY